MSGATTTSDCRWGVRLSKEYFNFCVAHFLIFDAEHREPLHGHNYRVAVSIEGELGPEGLVLDFIAVKPLVRALCEQVDHHTVFPARSPHLTIAESEGQVVVRFGAERFALPASDVVLLPIENTSVEHFARWFGEHLFESLREKGLAERVRCLEVEVSESAGQAAYCARRFGPGHD